MPTQNQTDAAAAQTALAKSLPQISAALDLIGSDDSGASSPSGAPHDTAAKDNLAASYFGFTEAKVLVDAVVADLNPVTPPPVVTPPPTTGKPDFGVFHGNDQAPAVTPARYLDYCDANASTYTFTPARIAFSAGKKLMVKCGDLAPGQPAAFAKVLIAGGHPTADVPIMWEDNQDVWETWNENKYTAAQFIARFLAIVAEMDAVPGAKFNHWWCPNLGQTGNQAPGRNQLDTWPGVGPNKNIGIAPDGYFSASDGSDIIAQLAPFEALAKSAGARFGGLCETGPNNGSNDATALDVPNAWTALLNHAEANGWEFVIDFGLKKGNGGSFNSDNGPKSIAAIQAFYA